MAEDLGYAEKLPEIREWYDGYSFSGIEIYNPWSVINYFQQGCQPNIYWLNTSGNAIIGEMMKHLADEDEEELLSLLQSKPVNAMLDEGVIYTEIYGDRDALYTVLLTTGYLKSVSTKLQEGMTFSALAIPNREVQTVYRREILNRYRGKMAQSALQMVLEHLTEGRAEEFAKGLE